MQSKNQVVILSVSILKNKKKRPLRLRRTIRPTALEKRDRHPTLLLPPGLQTLFFTFTMLWMCPAKNGVDLVEVHKYFLFYKSEKMSSQMVQPVALLYLIMVDSLILVDRLL